MEIELQDQIQAMIERQHRLIQQLIGYKPGKDNYTIISINTIEHTEYPKLIVLGRANDGRYYYEIGLQPRVYAEKQEFIPCVEQQINEILYNHFGFETHRKHYEMFNRFGFKVGRKMHSIGSSFYKELGDSSYIAVQIAESGHYLITLNQKEGSSHLIYYSDEWEKEQLTHKKFMQVIDYLESLSERLRIYEEYRQQIETEFTQTMQKERRLLKKNDSHVIRIESIITENIS